jgi:hypothetical protein
VAQEVDAAQERTIKAEVNSFIDQYTQWFEEHRTDLIAQKVYLSPSVRVTPTGPTVMASVESIGRTWEGILEPLIADGYTRSEWPARNICVLNESAAVVSAHFVRYRKDGSVIGDYGATYTLVKGSDGWRIVSVVTHTAARVLQCTK